ncbi:MAG: hypothetical protein NDI94_05665 [Candidatus Woesearchaeota archaeon]|nr:hypothetical protein [Candidatus Woesearchaeota archaeon]
MSYGFGFVIKDKDYDTESSAGVFVSMKDASTIALEFQLLVNQPTSIIPAFHFMELLYEEQLILPKTTKLVASASLVERLDVPIAEKDTIQYNRRTRTTEAEDYFGINHNVILLHPDYLHSPGNVLTTYGQFILDAYASLPVGAMKPRGILIPKINEDEFNRAVEAAISNQRSNTAAPTLAFSIDEYKSVMCYFYTSSGSKALKAPKSKDRKRAELYSLIQGYNR